MKANWKRYGGLYVKEVCKTLLETKYEMCFKSQMVKTYVNAFKTLNYLITEKLLKVFLKKQTKF